MMWDLGNFTNSSASSSMAASLHAMHEIHVLLVDHEPEALIHTAKQLELCHYRVTLVELASAAISMLLSGKAKFDVVIANINSPDLHGFKLLQQAVTMALPIVLMSVDENAFMAMRALESGAFLYIKKPATMEILRYLWQLVMRERRRIIMGGTREREFLANNNNINHGPNNLEINPHPPPNLEELMMMKNKKMKKAISRRQEEECDDDDSEMNNNVRKKMCTEWTHELHAKFMNAVEILGEGRCFPKEILDLMNVPGLTRMQVASHLQKCRNDNWKSPEERKPAAAAAVMSTTTTNVQGSSSSSGSGSQPKPRRFGSKPQVGKTSKSSTQLQGSESPINFAYHHKKYGAIGYVHGISNSPNPPPNNPNNELFNFPQTEDFLIHNLSGRQGFQADHPNDHQNQNNSGDQADAAAAASVETRSLWSSDTSNFESTEDHSNHQ